MDIDIELALLNASASDIEDLSDNLPSDFHVEDRCDKGWGLVIRSGKGTSSVDINAEINLFLEPLSDLEKGTQHFDRLRRAAVFYNTVNCTLLLAPPQQLLDWGLALEISTYPCVDE